MRLTPTNLSLVLKSLTSSFYRRVSLVALLLAVSGSIVLMIVRADNTAQTLPFSQNWTNTGLITANDNWSGVAGIEGYLGQDITTATGADPQTLLTTSAVANDLDVIANQANPNTQTSGGVAEFDGIANPTIALQGSGTADAPYVLIHLNTSGLTSINVAYNLRDIDGSADNAVQPVALQYRIGNSGNFTNLPAGFVADATTGPSLATLVTPVSVTLPVAANNQPLVQVRIITANAAGSDEWVGIDDISITGQMTGLPTNPTGTGLATPNTIVAGNSTLLTVAVNPGGNPTSTGLAVTADLTSIGGSATQTFFDNGTNGDVTSGDNTFSYSVTVPANTTSGGKTLSFNITDAQTRSGSGSISLTVQAPPPPSDHVVISQIYGGGGNSGATYQNDYVELYNPSVMTFNLNGWSVQYASSTSSFGAPSTITPLAGSIAPGEYYLVKLGSGGAVGLALPPANVEGATNLSATAGKIALVNNTDPLSDGSSPCTLGDPNLVDFVGFGTAANCREGSANAPAGSNTLSILRNSAGAADTNQNANDFTAGAPNPRRTATIVDAPPFVSSTDTDADAFASTPAPRDASIAVFFSEPVVVIGNWYSLTCVNTGPHTTVVAAGPQNWVITPDVNFQPGEQCTFQIFAANVKDADLDDSVPNTDFMQSDYSTTFTVASDAVAPYDPTVHLTMGNPSNAVTDINQPNNYLLLKPEYSVSYNRDRGGPNWVSWHLADDWTGSLTRVDTFRPDPQLPAAWNRVNQFDYAGSGFDRGHMTPSADRLASLPLNQATFLMDNIIPQAPDNNQITWNNMEQALRALTPANELYIISGGAGIGGSGDNGPANTIAGGRITVPAYTWKVALVIPKGTNDIARVDCSTRSIAVIVPNTNGTNSDWTAYLTTVDAVEALTGYDFFSNLPIPIQRCVEAGINGVNPPLDTDGDGVSDVNDLCPNTPPNTQVTSNGCPLISAPCPAISAVASVAITPVTFVGTGGTGSPYTFSATGLPAGLTISTGGTISGTPTVTGTFPYVVTVRDKDLNQATVNCSVTVVCPTIAVTPTTVPTGTAGSVYGPVQFSQTGSNAAITWSVTSNNLPAGLTLNPSTGQLSGTPTVAAGVNITIRATDANNCFGEVIVTLQINCPTITISPSSGATTTLTAGTVGQSYSQTFTAAPAGGGYTYSIPLVAIPAGLTFNTSTGVLSGIPTTPGTYGFTVTATGFGGCTGQQAYSLTIGCQTISIAPAGPALTAGTVGGTYSQQLTATNGTGTVNFTLMSGSFPTGVTMNLVGLISGTPTVAGTFNITVKATDSNQCSNTKDYSITINCQTITVTAPAVNTGTAGAGFTQTFTQSGGIGATTFSTVSALPTGLTLSSGGVLSGTPSQSGTFPITVKATDANGCFGTVSYSLTISATTPPSTARIADPLVCTGPGNTVAVTATVTNSNLTTQTANFTATLTPTLRALPGICTVNVGACQVVNASTITWAGTLAANQTVTINYLAQVNDGVPAGTQLCATSVATVGNSLPATVTACGTVNCPAAGPGLLAQTNSPMNDQKPGSVLIFNIYTSSTNANQQNTRINLTNTNTNLSSFVHLFFVDGTSCSVADSILCLTPNQTTSFLASDLDPGSTGYIVAIAIDGNGCPTNFNYLIGDEYVKFATGHAANLGAESISAIAGGLPLCDSNSVTATLAFDGLSYNVVPRVLAVDNIPSRADGNDTLLILNRIGGNLATGPSTLGTIFGLLYDDSESVLSFSVTGSCQLRNSLSSSFPRTTPRFEQFIPSGRSGWMRLFSQSDIGITGAAINFNANATTSAGAFNQGHNLHALTNTSTATYSIPVFPPGC